MFRKLMALALLLCLAALARAEGNLLLPLGEGEEVGGLLTDGEALYILGENLSVWRGEDAAVQSWRDGIDLPGAMAFEATVAFVNPYSAHPEAALDLMEALLTSLPTRTRYLLCADLTEPVVDPAYERGAANLQQSIAELQARLDAAEPKDRQALEEARAALEREREDYEANNKWLIPSGKLEWYRAHGDRACLKAPSWFEKDTSGEAWQLLEQYDAGLIPARQFLAAVSQKARMMALEGE